MEHVNLQYSMEHTPVVRLYIVLNACRGAHCGGCGGGGGVTPPKICHYMSALRVV